MSEKEINKSIKRSFNESDDLIGMEDRTPCLVTQPTKRSRFEEDEDDLNNETIKNKSEKKTIDFTLTLAHHIFMNLFELLPTRYWLELGLVSKHWLKMRNSFFAIHNRIDFSELGREAPTTVSESIKMRDFVQDLCQNKSLKLQYKDHLIRYAMSSTSRVHTQLVKDIWAIPLIKNLKLLRFVDFSFCDHITDRTLIALGDHAPLVERAYFLRCLLITGVGVSHLLNELKHLHALNVGWCPKVDDDIVDLDFDGSRQLALQSVQLSWTNVSLEGVFTLIGQCRSLKEISYGFGRSPLYDTFLCRPPNRKFDPPIEPELDEYATVKPTELLVNTDRQAFCVDKSNMLRLAPTKLLDLTNDDDNDVNNNNSNNNNNNDNDNNDDNNDDKSDRTMPALLHSTPNTLDRDDDESDLDPAGLLRSRRTGAGGRLSAGENVHLATSVMPGCFPCRSPFCTEVESAPFDYGVCAGCKSAMYCSKACQGLGWHFGHSLVCRLQKPRSVELAKSVAFSPVIARGIASCANLHLFDASGNRPFADIALSAMLVHQARYLSSLRAKRATNENNENNESRKPSSSSSTTSNRIATHATSSLSPTTRSCFKSPSDFTFHYEDSFRDNEEDDFDDDIVADPSTPYSVETHDSYPSRYNGSRLQRGQTSQRRLLRTQAMRREASGRRRARRASSGIQSPPPHRNRHLVIAPRSNVRDRYGGAYGGEPFLFMHTIQRNRWLYLMENNPSKPVNIKTLCLSKCLITDGRLRALSIILPFVISLDLEKSCITDVGVRIIAEKCVSLRHFQITGASLTFQTGPILVSSESIRNNLRSLLIGGTSAMSDKEAEHVIVKCNKLKRFYIWSQVGEERAVEFQRSLDDSRELLVLAKPRQTSDFD